jgi:hypothetical protein
MTASRPRVAAPYRCRCHNAGVAIRETVDADRLSLESSLRAVSSAYVAEPQ